MENNNNKVPNLSLFLFDEEQFLDMDFNFDNGEMINDINESKYTSLFINNFEINENDIRDIISDINNKKSIPIKKVSEKNEKNKNKEVNNKIKKNKKYAISNLIRKVKKVLFNSLLNYDNYIISKEYEYNIGNGIYIKKLFKINYFQIKNISKNFNKQLLNTPQGVIFSSDISKKYSYYPKDHNKQLIKKLINEKNKEKNKKFNDLFNVTLLGCINHLLGYIKSESLEGFNKFYDEEIIELDEKYKELLKKVIKNLGSMFTIKKQRKRNNKK